ncbi:unnamed protein product, partial [Tuber aestivum]
MLRHPCRHARVEMRLRGERRERCVSFQTNGSIKVSWADAWGK